MNQRGKRRMAKLLALVMLATLLCGSTVMAQPPQLGEWLYVDSIRTGSIIRGISAGGPNGVYRDYDFFVNGQQYSFMEDGSNVSLDGYCEVQSVQVDHTNKTVHVTGERMIEIYAGNNNFLAKAGETVTLNLSEDCKADMEARKGDTFIKWALSVYAADRSRTEYTLEEAAAVLGVPAEQLKDPAAHITFTVPSVWLTNQYRSAGFYPAFHGDSTVSGNVPSGSDKSESSDSGSTPAAEAAARKQVVLSDGTTLTSTGSMHNTADGINGAAVIIPQEEMNAGAGLTPQEIQAGSNARLYLGNTYKKAEKEMLAQAVAQTGAKALHSINIDLYTIAKSGAVNNVRTLVGENAKPVRVVIGLPADAVKDGRSFVLVYMDENGKAIEIPDLDNDPRTLTVDLTRFGAFAIVYR